ncbi:hypothetical protein [Glycomyces tarimensis]
MNHTDPDGEAPAWLFEALDGADRVFEHEAALLRRRLYREALTAAMRAHTPAGLPELEWRASRWDEGTVHVWARPTAGRVICLFEEEIRQGAADCAAWLAALEGPAMTETVSHSEGHLTFQAPLRLAGVGFILRFDPYTDQIGADAVRRIVAESAGSIASVGGVR